MVGLCKMSQSLMDGRAQARCVASSYQLSGLVLLVLCGRGRIVKRSQW